MDKQAGHTLISLARSAIATRLGISQSAPPADAPWLRKPGATWVTLLRDQKMRGRTGSLTAHRALADDVTANAIAAACSDLRFEPLTRGELADVRIEICLLSDIEPIPSTEEAAALSMLRPGIDGAIFEYGRHHSSFLPEVWSTVADRGDFMAQLKYRAGLPPDFWDRNIKISRYTVSRWEEAGA